MLLLTLNIYCQESIIANQLQTYFDSLAKNTAFNGAMLYKENDKILFEKAYGFADFDNKTPFRTDTKMEIASVSKQFTSMAIMLLKEEGKLNLDSSANKYLPLPLENKNITVRNLLTHTSGIAEYQDFFEKNWNSNRKCENKDILKFYSIQKPVSLFEPGTSFNYSNGGYILLAEMVHFISGMPLDKFLEEEIFKPYGFGNTGFVDRDSILTIDNYAPGYFYDSTAMKYVLPETIAGNEYYYFLSKRLGPGRLTSTIEEISKWDSLLATNSLISNDAYCEMYTPQIIPGIENNYAFGWRVDTDKDYGWHIHHTGSWAGNRAYNSRFMMVPCGKNSEDDDSELEKFPDQTLIIFSNINLKMNSIYKYCDDLIIRSRKGALNNK